MAKDTDQQLVDRVLGGDKHAFDLLVLRYQHRVAALIGRFVNEFFREPDAQLAEFARETGLSMGQWLSLPMIAVGLGVMIYALSKPPVSGAKKPVPKPHAA